MEIAKIALASVSIAYLLLLVGSVSAQNMTNQTMTSMNMTNATGSATGSALAKVKILEAIKSLEIGDKSSALVELTAAQQAIAGESDQAKMHFNEGMKSFTGGDPNNALMHLKAVLNFLG
ncbi:MAG TPA: hypothetical protein VHH33_00405 [Nitrososphaeraceae archaeon]|nr:hypothetical protein [Nitrososphaeraceae archaeon]